MTQPRRSRAQTIAERPEGLLYRPDLLAAGEERDLLVLLDELEFREVVMRGQVARRTVRHFGLDYDYGSYRLVPADPLPPWLLPVRERCAELAGREPDAFVQALVSCYPAGAGIGWHRDAPAFGSSVAGVSLLSSCRMRLQRRVGDVRHLHELELEPRSAYVLSGAARWS